MPPPPAMASPICSVVARALSDAREDPGSSERADAAQLLAAVVHKRRTLDQLLAHRDTTALTRELLFGSLRHYYRLSARVRQCLDRPLREGDAIVGDLLIVGAYQLAHTRIPPHAAVHATVAAAGAIGRPRARGLINAVLRRLAREAEGAEKEPERTIDLPAWLEKALTADYGEGAEALMAACQRRAPMGLRVTAGGRQALEQRLGDAGLTAEPFATDHLILDRPCPVAELPGFNEGQVSVQDPGAGFAAQLLLAGAPRPARLLDACAAPGGKLFHLADRLPEGRIVALERSAPRLEHLQREAERLGAGHRGGVRIDLQQADATTLDWWDGDAFDAILLDAPCTGTGTLRRHPDIKVLLRPTDAQRLARQQLALLANVWQTLAPGGSLLYCTCSLLTTENDAVLAQFLKDHADAMPQPIRLPTGQARRYGWQLTPADPRTDGFYYALLRRSPDPDAARAPST